MGGAEWSWENDMKPMEPLQVKPSQQHGNFTIIPWGFHGITRVFATHFPHHSYQ
jgi:hypothetical protein